MSLGHFHPVDPNVIKGHKVCRSRWLGCCSIASKEQVDRYPFYDYTTYTRAYVPELKISVQHMFREAAFVSVVEQAKLFEKLSENFAHLECVHVLKKLSGNYALVKATHVLMQSAVLVETAHVSTQPAHLLTKIPANYFA
ncbi:hypothetical protein GQ457_17G018510 [Hibiscus cannabinus]